MTKTKVAVLTIASVVALMIVATVLASPPQPTYDSAVVDGDYSEWDLEKDLFAPMCQAGNPDKPELSSLFLRYNCSSDTLYLLVLPASDVTMEVNGSEEHWAKINGKVKVDDQVGQDGEAPDFAWIETSENGTAVGGWEASLILSVKGIEDYRLSVHSLISDSEEVQTSATGPITLTVDCLSTPLELDENSLTATQQVDNDLTLNEKVVGVVGAAIVGLAMVGIVKRRR